MNSPVADLDPLYQAQVRNRLTNRQTVIAEYEPQDDDMEVTRAVNADY